MQLRNELAHHLSVKRSVQRSLEANMLAIAWSVYSLALVASLSLSALLQAQEVPAPKSAADVPGTPPGTIMTKDYVAMVGRLAYIWGWPLVNNLNRALAVQNLPEPGRIGGVLPASPPGYVSMLTDYIDEQQRFVACPNQDTVYGAGYQRLDTKPVTRCPTSVIASIRTGLPMRARTRLPRSASSMELSQASISWSGLTGRVTHRRASMR
jgi:hypothetical protein